jgi:predicted RecA/RadA family phage recombinase
VGIQAPTSEVILTTPSGHGSTNTKIRNFTVKESQTGTALSVTYNDATNGTSVQLLEDGVYAITYSADYSTAGTAFIGASVDSTQLTTNLSSITASGVLMATATAANTEGSVSVTRRLRAGQVIRPHTNGFGSGATAAYIKFTVTKVSN